MHLPWIGLEAMEGLPVAAEVWLALGIIEGHNPTRELVTDKGVSLFSGDRAIAESSVRVDRKARGQEF